MGFVQHPISKMADKKAYQCMLSWSPLVIFYRISSKFHVWIASIKILFKFKYKFNQTNDNQDGRQNGRCLSICFCGQSTLIIYYPITSKFYYMDYFYQTLALSDNQDGHQNGCHLSVYTCGHSNLVIYHPISSKFHIWTTFIKLLFMSEYGFCPMNDYQDFLQNGYPLFAAGH